MLKSLTKMIQEYKIHSLLPFTPLWDFFLCSACWLFSFLKGDCFKREGTFGCILTVLLNALQVLALDKRFLDPRRSLNPTQAEKEEGILPLTDSLPIIPQVIHISSEYSLAFPPALALSFSLECYQ